MAERLHASVSPPFFVEKIFKTDVLNLVVLTALLKISRHIRAEIMQGVALFQLSNLNKEIDLKCHFYMDSLCTRM